MKSQYTMLYMVSQVYHRVYGDAPEPTSWKDYIKEVEQYQGSILERVTRHGIDHGWINTERRA